MKDFFSDPQNNFIIGILSGLGVALILYVLGISLKYFKRFFIDRKIINVWSKSKILYIYDNQEKAEKQMLEDARNSETMFVFAYFETMLTYVTGSIYELLKTKTGNIKILYADPDSPNFNKRVKELNLNMTPETSKGHIATIKELQKNNSNIQFVLHNELSRYKFFIFDNVIYLGFRLKDKISDTTQIYRIGKESHLYKSFLEQFNDYWEKYSSLPQEKT